MNLLKAFRRITGEETNRAKGAKLFLRSEHAPCTCPEPCERDHGNE